MSGTPFRTILKLLALASLFTAVMLVVFATQPAEAPQVAQPIFYAKAEPTRLLFVGDMMFDRTIRKTGASSDFAHTFSCIRERLLSYDAVIGNLEGPITTKPSVSLGSEVGSDDNFIFTFPPSTAQALKDNNVRIVSLGNNHILNQGKEGLAETRQRLDVAGVGHFGGVAGDTMIYHSVFSGRPFSFIAFNEFGGESASTTAAHIAREVKAGNTVIVFAHWGDEYVDVVPRVRSWTNLFLQSGASAVIGSHPHVAQGGGSVDGRPYYYSLGNFIFDQYWNTDVSTGLAVEITFDGARITTRELSVTLKKDGTTCISG